MPMVVSFTPSKPTTCVTSIGSSVPLADFGDATASRPSLAWVTARRGSLIPITARTRRLAADSPRRRARTRIDLYRGGHSGRQDHTWRHVIDMNAHRDPLGQTHPGKYRIDLSQALPVGLRVCDVDAPGCAAVICQPSLLADHIRAESACTRHPLSARTMSPSA